MNLILGMIVRNEEEILKLTLPLSHGLRTLKIALLFPSSDLTRQVLQEFNWQIFEGSWLNDYSIARNTLLQIARDSAWRDAWMLQLDADECMWPEAIEQVSTFCAKQSTDLVSLPRYNFIRGSFYESSTYPDLQTRCVRLSSSARYRLPVHEVIDGDAARIHVPHIHHYGWCKSPRQNWLRSHNYTLLAEGKKTLTKAPPSVHNDYSRWLADMRQRHTFTPFEGDHPLRNHLWT